MKILHELNQLEKGGAERVVAGIIKHDEVNEHLVYTYKDGPMRPILEAAGATVLIENDETENVDCDIIHIHTGGAESVLANMVKNQIPTVETVHSPVVSAVRDEYVVERVGVSNQVTILNRKCRRIYNGVDVDRLNRLSEDDAREELGIPDNAQVIGRLGRIGTDKYVEEFLLACKAYQDNHDCYILIVGDEAATEKGYLGIIKVMAASLPLKNVIFVPATEDVGKYYRTMDVFLYPSPTEGFGLVFFEAMASGVPVITYKNPLTREMLTGAALLVENNIPALANGLENILFHGEITDELIEAGLDIVNDMFTAQEMSLKYQEFYNGIYARSYDEPARC